MPCNIQRFWNFPIGPERLVWDGISWKGDAELCPVFWDGFHYIFLRDDPKCARGLFNDDATDSDETRVPRRCHGEDDPGEVCFDESGLDGFRGRPSGKGREG